MRWIIFILVSLQIQARVVFISDSHGVGEFGKQMYQHLKKYNNQFVFFASGGSAPMQWLNGKFTTPCGISKDENSSDTWVCEKLLTPKLETLLKNQPATHVIINLGTNFGASDEMLAAHLKESKTLIKKLRPEDTCTWIAPPDMKRYRGKRIDDIYGVLRQAIAETDDKCAIIESIYFSYYPDATNANSNPDGIHYDYPANWYRFPEGVEAAKEWFNGIIDLMKI